MMRGTIHPEKYIYLEEGQSLLCVKPSESLRSSLSSYTFKENVDESCILLNKNFSIDTYCNLEVPSENSGLKHPTCHHGAKFEASHPFNFLFQTDRYSIRAKRILLEYLANQRLAFSRLLEKGIILSLVEKSVVSLLEVFTQ